MIALPVVFQDVDVHLYEIVLALLGGVVTFLFKLLERLLYSFIRQCGEDDAKTIAYV